MLKKVGKYTYGHNSIKFSIFRSDKVAVSIGAFTTIADNVVIFESQGEGHFYNEGSSFPFGLIHTDIFNNYKNRRSYEINLRDIKIGNDVWIGSCVSISPGSVIGDGAVVAINSHVVGEIKPYSICGGNPARLIKYRFTEDIISEFIKLKWWELDDHIINKIFKNLYGYIPSSIYIYIRKRFNRTVPICTYIFVHVYCFM